VTVKVAGSVQVQLAVYNAAGELVKLLATYWTSGTVKSLTLSDTVLRQVGDKIDLYFNGRLLASWDGLDTRGLTVANGAYYIKMDVVDAYGVDDAVIKAVSVEFPQRWVKVTVYNAAGEGARWYNAEQVQEALAGGGNLKTEDLKVSSVRLSPLVISPSYTNPSAPDGSAVLKFPSGATMSWDGRNSKGEIVANGQYEVEVRSWGDTLTEQTILLPVAVLHGNLNQTQTVLAPNPVHLSRDTQAVFRIVSADPSVDHVEVRLYTLTGNLVQKLTNEPGDITRVVWTLPGTGGHSYMPGAYLAVVEQKAGTGVLNRNVLKVLVVD
jgi:flagellar hook assembly protein FlgD